jgi:hypothetical protein
MPIRGLEYATLHKTRASDILVLEPVGEYPNALSTVLRSGIETRL